MARKVDLYGGEPMSRNQIRRLLDEEAREAEEIADAAERADGQTREVQPED